MWSRFIRLRRRRNGWAGALALALVPLLGAGLGVAEAGEPGAIDEPAGPTLCCGVPPRDEVTADQVFGRWVVTTPGVGLLRPGERVEFRRDGTLDTARGPCRFAVLRAELTVTCADKSQSGEIRFVDDTKLIWRFEGKEATFIAPAD